MYATVTVTLVVVILEDGSGNIGSDSVKGGVSLIGN